MTHMTFSFLHLPLANADFLPHFSPKSLLPCSPVSVLQGSTHSSKLPSSLMQLQYLLGFFPLFIYSYIYVLIMYSVLSNNMLGSGSVDINQSDPSPGEGQTST